MTVLTVGAAGVVASLLAGLVRSRRPIGSDSQPARPLLAGLTALRPSITPGLRLAVGGIAFVAALGRLTREPERYGCVPVASLLVVASAALVAARLVAVRPGLRAARTPAAALLHDE